MSAAKTPERLSVDLRLVTELAEEQFPELSHLPVSELNSTGTENAVYRLGQSALIRLPTTEGAAQQVSKEQRWLPRFAEVGLPLAIPELIAAGAPNQHYPYNWSIYKWLKGKPATVERITDIRDAAERLGQFVVALQEVDAEDGPAPGNHNFFRGVPLAERDDITQEALRRLHAEGLDTREISNAWEEAVAAPAWDGSPVWIHGDLADSNMLAKRRRKSGDRRELSAIIDFGGAAVGDPACDLLVGWDVLAEARDTFLEAVHPDVDTIRRGRGWAISTGVMSLVRFPDRPEITSCALRKINQAVSDRTTA